jgi:CBS domain-containing protein
MEISVDEYTSPILVTIKLNESLDRALEVMQANGIRHLPVEKEGKILGIISERDVMTHIGKNWASMVKVDDIMNTDLFSVYRRESLGEVAFQLSTRKLGSALVLDENSEVYGIFTTTDALNALVEIFYPEARERSEIRGVEL